VEFFCQTERGGEHASNSTEGGRGGKTHSKDVAGCGDWGGDVIAWGGVGKLFSKLGNVATGRGDVGSGEGFWLVGTWGGPGISVSIWGYYVL